MVDFAALTEKLRNRRELDCAQCGQQFLAMPDETLCDECAYYRHHPERAPGYFTWTKSARGWAAQARWKDGQPSPEPGDQIVIHRRDGSSQTKTVVECYYHGYDPSGYLLVRCNVS